MAGMPAALRLGLAVAYFAAGAFCLRRVVRASGAGERLGYGTHALMALSMATTALFKPWWPDWQMVVFAVAGGWYAVRATGTSLAVAAVARAPGLRVRCAHHAVVMAAMVWMLYATVSAPPASATGGMAAPGVRAPALSTVSGVYCLIAAVLLLSASGVAAVRRRGAAEDAVYAVMTAGAGMMLLAI